MKLKEASKEQLVKAFRHYAKKGKFEAMKKISKELNKRGVRMEEPLFHQKPMV